MVQQLVRRVCLALGAAWLVASAIFLLSRGLAGSAPRLFSEEAATIHADKAQRVNNEARYRQRLGLQEPLFYCRVLPWAWHGLPNQYHTWVTGLAHGELGISYRDGVPVEQHLRAALAVTLPLTVSSLLLAAVIALGAALAAARSSRLHRLLVPAAYAVDSLPLFVIGVFLLLLFANPDIWPLFPAFGLGDAYGSAEAPLAGFADQLYHLALPVASLTLLSIPVLFLPTEAALRQQWQQPYVTTALAKGASAQEVWRRHVLPNALPVFVTRFSDLLPDVAAGAVVAEVVFALPGMGRLLAEAATARDLPLLVGGVLLLAAVRLFSWLLADVAHATLDPRFRWH